MSNRQARVRPRPTATNGLEGKHRNDFSKLVNYERSVESKLARRASKGKKKKKMKKASSGGFWDTLFSLGAKFLPKVLPFIFAKGPSSSVSLHSGPSAGAEVPIPAAVGTVFRTAGDPVIESIGKGRVRISHSGLLGKLVTECPTPTVSTTYKLRGDVIFKMKITPDITTWLKRVCSYQHYRFKNLAVTVQPSVPATTAGRIMGCFITDVDNPLPEDQGETTVKSAAALSSAVETDIWTPHTFVASFRENDWYYTAQNGVEPRSNVQGVFYVIACSDFNSTIPSPFADLLVSYELEAEGPVLVPDPAVGVGGEVAENYEDRESGIPFGSGIDDLHFHDSQGDYASCTVVPRYTSSGPHDAAGSFFQFPVGLWAISWRAVGTGFGETANDLFRVMGNYRILSTKYGDGTDGGTTLSYQVSTTAQVGSLVFASTGFESGSYLYWTLTFTTCTTSRLRYAAIGGHVEQVSSLAKLTTDVQKLQELIIDKGKEKAPSTAATVTIERPMHSSSSSSSLSRR